MRRTKRYYFKAQNACGIGGKHIDKTFKAPHPLSPVVDHIVPINKGGHPSSIENLQLAHWTCNRQKSDKLYSIKDEAPKVVGNRNLPQSTDWASYGG